MSAAPRPLTRSRKVAQEQGFGTLTHSAYAEIRGRILSLALKPGCRVTIKALQSELDIGPTPIREALARLASEGFVVGEENRGYRISDVTLTALRDIVDQRKLVECSGLKRSVERGGPAYVARVTEVHARLVEADRARAAGEPGAFAQWETVHREFHAALLSAAQSSWLMQFQNILFDHADRYRRIALDHASPPPRIAQDHLRILEAIQDGDGEMASLILARHIERTFAAAKAAGLKE